MPWCATCFGETVVTHLALEDLPLLGVFCFIICMHRLLTGVTLGTKEFEKVDLHNFTIKLVFNCGFSSSDSLFNPFPI